MGDSTQGPQVRTDRDNLQGVDIRQHNTWLSLIFSVFRQKQLAYVAPYGGGGNGLQARAIDPTRALTVGYSSMYNQRIGATADKILNPSHGQMSAIPTPQALIRQVTGIGDPITGR
jgi:hypothetical protein